MLICEFYSKLSHRKTEIMLKRAVRSLLSHSSTHRVKCASAMSTVTSEQTKEKWDLYAAVLVERLPVISKSLNKIEQTYLVNSDCSLRTYQMSLMRRYVFLSILGALEANRIRTKLQIGF